MRVLISGASGMIGRLCQGFGARHDVLTLVRPESNRSGISWHPGVALEDHPDLEGLDAVVHLAGAGIADRRWTTARKNLCGTVEWNRPPIFDPLLKNATLRPRGSSVLPPLAGTATGTTTSLTNHLHQAMDSWRTSARLGVSRSKQHDGQCLFAIWLGAGSIWRRTEKNAPPFQLGLGGPLGSGRHWQSWIGLDDAVRHIMHLCTALVEDVRGVHNVVAPTHQQRDFASALGKALKRPAWLPAPRWAVQLLFGDMAKEALLASTRVIPTRRLKEGPSFLTPNLQDALRLALNGKSKG